MFLGEYILYDMMEDKVLETRWGYVMVFDSEDAAYDFVDNNPKMFHANIILDCVVAIPIMSEMDFCLN